MYISGADLAASVWVDWRAWGSTHRPPNLQEGATSPPAVNQPARQASLEATSQIPHNDKKACSFIRLFYDAVSTDEVI